MGQEKGPTRHVCWNHLGPSLGWNGSVPGDYRVLARPVEGAKNEMVHNVRIALLSPSTEHLMITLVLYPSSKPLRNVFVMRFHFL